MYCTSWGIPATPTALVPSSDAFADQAVVASHHQFWADALSWSATSAIRGDRVLAHGQITDVYLLALLCIIKGCLPASIPVSIRVSSRVDRTPAFDPILVLMIHPD